MLLITIISIPDMVGFEPTDGKTINVFQVRRNRPLCHISSLHYYWGGGSRTHSVKDASFTAKCRTVLRHPMKVMGLRLIHESNIYFRSFNTVLYH